MEQQNNNQVLTKPNAFITSLQTNTAVTIARFSRYTPIQIEDAYFEHYKIADELDTLSRSKKFFEEQYKGDDKETFLSKIDEQIVIQSDLLAVKPKIENIGELYRINPDSVENGLKILINDLRLFFQVDNMISTEGIISLCPLIIFEYPNLALEEIAVCFARAKKGYYGELYNRLDGSIILKWIKQYNSEKMARLLDRNYVVESHAKIGIGEGRKDFKGDHDQMIKYATNVIAVDRAKWDRKELKQQQKAKGNLKF